MINDTIKAERWGSMRPAFRDHNASLDRIEAAVMAELEKLLAANKRPSDSPDPGLIESMAMRFDHSFVMMTDSEKDTLRRQMCQVWEEVVGLGFYNPTRKAKEPCVHSDTVLKAIDLAKWDCEDFDTFNTLSDCGRSNALRGANRQIEAIRKAYLESIDTGKMHCPHCAGELLRVGSIYRCPDCNKIWNINEQEEA